MEVNIDILYHNTKINDDGDFGIKKVTERKQIDA